MQDIQISDYRSISFKPASLYFSIDPITNFLLDIRESSIFLCGWFITVTWLSPNLGFEVQWRVHSTECNSTEFSEYFRSLGGSFEDNHCTFDVPPVDTLVFEYKFVAKLPQ